MPTRRQVIATTGTVLAGGAMLSQSASASTEIDFDVPERVEFESSEGYLQYLRVSPTYNLTYSGFSEGAEKARVRLFATVGGKTREVTKTTDASVSGVEGEATGSLPQGDLVDIFGDDTFTTGETDVHFRLHVEFQTAGTYDGPESEATATTTVVVKESGNSSSVDVGGSLSFDGQGA